MYYHGTAARAHMSSAPSIVISYWIIVPETGTDNVVAALRSSWLRTLRSEHVHFCVANNSQSKVHACHAYSMMQCNPDALQ